MFTGLVEDIGEIQKSARRSNGLELTVMCGIPTADITLGESIAVDGVCLTVTGTASRGFTVDVSSESIARSTLGKKKAGHRVNIERALRLSDRLGGHLVTGHIDGIVAITGIERKGDFTQFSFTAPHIILKYIVEKGSVAIDGISLTVNQCSDRDFSIMIIPHTLEQTTLSSRRIGEQVNIENDIVGKYIEKFILNDDTAQNGISREFLEKFNFT